MLNRVFLLSLVFIFRVFVFCLANIMYVSFTFTGNTVYSVLSTIFKLFGFDGIALARYDISPYNRISDKFSQYLHYI